MMQFVHQVSIGKRPQLKKRTSSATFNSKKIKAILTSRQTSDETIICKLHKQPQLPPTVSSRIVNYHRKEKSNVQFSNQQLQVKRCQKKTLLDVIRPMKYEKSSEENLLLKNCDKSKLIYWSKDLVLSGREKYALISADLLMDQDNFWEKASLDNGQFNGNLVSGNYQSTTLARNRNINMPLPPKSGSSSLNGLMNLSRRNPLMNWSKINVLLRQWRSLHARVGPDGRRVVVLWVIRRQSSYGYLMEFAQTYQLPLHGIFYVKRKRSNQFFDLGLMVKEIHQKFFQSIITPPSTAQTHSPNTLKSIQGNADFRRSKSKQTHKLSTITSKKQSTQLSAQHNSHSTLNSLHSVTYKFVKSTKQQVQKEQYNDQNCQQRINVQTCKQFQLSKNNIVNKKKSLMSIIRNDERVRKAVKKVPSLLVTEIKRPATVKILQSVEKIQIYEKQSGTNMTKRYTTPLIANDDIDTLQIEELQQDLLVRIEEEQLQQKEEKFVRPQIFVFQGLKCNMRDNLEAGSYEGKLPLMLQYHNRRYLEVRQKLSQEGIEIVENRSKQGEHVKMFYIRYQMEREGMLERVNSLMKDIANKARSSYDLQPFNSMLCQEAPRLSQYISSAISSIMSQFSSYVNIKQRPAPQQPQPQQGSSESCNQQQQPCLTQQQQQQLAFRTQKQLQQIKKSMIAEVIAMKGRNYTFQNGESVYYYVGGMFKRNYNLIYNQYYNKYQAEMRVEMLGKGCELHSGKYSSSPMNSIKHQNNQPIPNITTPKLSPIRFFNLSNSPTIY